MRELKAKLSAYLQKAAGGEVITVTDRGRPIAVLGPPPGRVDLEAAVEAGWVTPAVGSGLAPFRPIAGTGRVLDALAQARDE
ncbi:MAG: type II toxin-antitoxin system Phd/YefM family antitoxin [Sporichthyaceae bacterium]